MEDEDAVRVLSVKDPARRLDNLSISQSSKVGRLRSASGVVDELINVLKDAANQGARCVRNLQRNVVRNGIQIA